MCVKTNTLWEFVIKKLMTITCLLFLNWHYYFEFDARCILRRKGIFYANDWNCHATDCPIFQQLFYLGKFKRDTEMLTPMIKNYCFVACSRNRHCCFFCQLLFIGYTLCYYILIGGDLKQNQEGFLKALWTKISSKNLLGLDTLNGDYIIVLGNLETTIEKPTP